MSHKALPETILVRCLASGAGAQAAVDSLSRQLRSDHDHDHDHDHDYVDDEDDHDDGDVNHDGDNVDTTLVDHTLHDTLIRGIFHPNF